MTDIAKIGFEVDTTGLEKGTKGLKDLDAAQKQVAQGAKDLNAAQQSYNSAADNVANKTTATGQSMGLFGRILNDIKGAFGGAKQGAEDAGASFTHTSGATREFRDVLHTLHPILFAAGTQIGGLGPLAMAARAGIGGLAVAITGSLMVSLQMAGDGLEIVRRRIEALYGQKGGDQMFGQIRDAARNTNVTIDSMANAVDNFLVALDRARHAPPLPEDVEHAGPTLGPGVPGGNVMLGPGVSASALGDATQQATKATDALVSVQKALGTTSSEAIKNVNDLLAAIAKGGGNLPADMFEQMTQVGNPLRSLAGALADQLGKGSNQMERMNNLALQLRDHVDEYGVAWKARVVDINDVRSAVERLAAAGDGLKGAGPGTLKQQFDDLTTSIGQLWAALGSQGPGGSSMGSFFTSMFQPLTAALKEYTDKVNAGKDTWLDFIRLLDTGPTISPDIFGPLISAIDTVINKVAQAISSLVQLMSMGTNQEANLNNSGPFFYAPTAGGFATGGQFTTSKATNVLFRASPDEVVTVEPPGNSAAARFLVGGNGGVDSQKVIFPAQSGTRVTITPPGQQLPNVSGSSKSLGTLADNNIAGDGGATTTLRDAIGRALGGYGKVAVTGLIGLRPPSASGAGGSTGDIGGWNGAAASADALLQLYYNSTTNYLGQGVVGSGLNTHRSWTADPDVMLSGVKSPRNPLGAPIMSGGFSMKGGRMGMGGAVAGATNASESGGNWAIPGAIGGPNYEMPFSDPTVPFSDPTVPYSNYGNFAGGGSFVVGGDDVAHHIGRDDKPVEFRLKLSPGAANQGQPVFVSSISQLRRNARGR